MNYKDFENLPVISEATPVPPVQPATSPELIEGEAPVPTIHVIPDSPLLPTVEEALTQEISEEEEISNSQDIITIHEESHESLFNFIYNKIMTNINNLMSLNEEYNLNQNQIIERRERIRALNPTTLTTFEDEWHDGILSVLREANDGLRLLIILEIEHLNDNLLYNQLLAERVGIEYFVRRREVNVRLRHRITNFLSRCRNRRYRIDRITRWTHVFAMQLRVFRRGRNVVRRTIELDD